MAESAVETVAEPMTSLDDLDKKKDELALSRRGDLPTKGAGKDSIEDELKKLSTEEDRSFHYMDSVHSKGTGKFLDGASDNSLTMDDSCASFASFGGSNGEDPDDSCSDLVLDDHKEAFTNLDPEITPRRKLLAKKRSNKKLVKAPSKRGSNLQLIEESDDL